MVIDGMLATNNFGSNTLLNVRKVTTVGGSDDDRVAYLKLDLTGVAIAPVSAHLTLTMDNTYTSTSGTMPVKVYGVSDITWTEGGITWTEGGITWNNAPGLDRTNVLGTGTLIDSQSVSLSLGGTATFDIGSYVAAHLGEIITLQIISETATTLLMAPNSRESTAPRPVLALDFAQRTIGRQCSLRAAGWRGHSTLHAGRRASSGCWDAAGRNPNKPLVPPGHAWQSSGYDA